MAQTSVSYSMRAEPRNRIREHGRCSCSMCMLMFERCRIRLPLTLACVLSTFLRSFVFVASRRLFASNEADIFSILVLPSLCFAGVLGCTVLCKMQGMEGDFSGEWHIAMARFEWNASLMQRIKWYLVKRKTVFRVVWIGLQIRMMNISPSKKWRTTNRRNASFGAWGLRTSKIEDLSMVFRNANPRQFSCELFRSHLPLNYPR